MHIRALAALSLLAAILSPASSARALLIIPTFGSMGGTPPAALQTAYNDVAKIYDNAFTNDIKINIDIEWTNLPATTNATQVVNGFTGINYTDWRNALAKVAQSPNAKIALEHIPATVPDIFKGKKLAVRDADLKAIRFPGLEFPQFDGIITFNKSLNWQFVRNKSGGVDPNSLDFVRIAEHETDEVLGLTSDLNNLAVGAPAPGTFDAWDMFRYNANHNRSYDTTTTAFFSIDAATNLIQFQRVSGQDYGDWVAGTSCPQPKDMTQRVQDAFTCPGSVANLGPLEIEALNVIGYTVPEPRSGLLFAAAVLGMLLVRHKRRAVRGIGERLIAKTWSRLSFWPVVRQARFR
jgi:hypothetical protein